MCCAVLLLMVPIVSLPLVFGGVRALPIAEELQSTTWWGEPQWSSSRNGAEVRTATPSLHVYCCFTSC